MKAWGNYLAAILRYYWITKMDGNMERIIKNVSSPHLIIELEENKILHNMYSELREKLIGIGLNTYVIDSVYHEELCGRGPPDVDYVLMRFG